MVRWRILLMLGGMLIGMPALAQQPMPTPAQLEEKAKADERTLVIIRQRELEMTRLVALYANKVDTLTEENARLHLQIETRPGCTPLPDSPKEDTN